MTKQLKQSCIYLLFLAVLFASPIIAVGYAAHGGELALIAAIGAVVFVLLGPLSFLFASELASTVGLIIISLFGALSFVFWLKALRRGPDSYLPYMSLTTWALLGAYFCIGLFFSHIGQ